MIVSYPRGGPKNWRGKPWKTSFLKWGYPEIILMRFSLINQPFWGTPNLGTPHRFPRGFTHLTQGRSSQSMALESGSRPWFHDAEREPRWSGNRSWGPVINWICPVYQCQDLQYSNIILPDQDDGRPTENPSSEQSKTMVCWCLLQIFPQGNPSSHGHVTLQATRHAATVGSAARRSEAGLRDLWSGWAWPKKTGWYWVILYSKH